MIAAIDSMGTTRVEDCIKYIATNSAATTVLLCPLRRALEDSIGTIAIARPWPRFGMQEQQSDCFCGILICALASCWRILSLRLLLGKTMISLLAAQALRCAVAQGWPLIRT
eukprot:scaffold11571_cov122-Cylindrotheca_fusiformis.AAC.16